jgi:ribonuclease HI
MASVFCDGACSGNGTKNAFGGWAWAYWPGPAYGEPTTAGAKRLASNETQTNQRAELTALLEAVRWLNSNQVKATIYSDSTYAINCASKWGPSWRKKGWKRDSGEPLQNLDIIRPLVELWKPCWRLQHVRGHQKGSGAEAYGNNWVDRAAVAAANGLELTPGPPAPAPPPASASAPAPASVPASASAPGPVRTYSSLPVKQADIRNWFG